MSCLSPEDLDTFSRCLAAIYASSDLPSHKANVAAVLRKVVPCELANYTRFHGAEVNDVSDPPNSLAPRQYAVLATLIHEHPRVNDYIRGGDARARAISDYLSRAEWQRCGLYREFCHAIAIEDQMSLMLPTRGGGITGLALNVGRWRFQPRDYEILNLLHPHLVQAHTTAVAFDRLQRRLHVAEGMVDQIEQGMAALTASGRLLECNAAGRGFLSTYFPDWHGRDAPSPVVQWLKSCHDARDRGDAVYPLTLGRGDKQLCIRRINGTDGPIRLIMEEHVAAASATSDLPPRIRPVLDRLLAGDSEKEVAQRLGLSQNTVHEYIKMLYAHFEVTSRSELLARWVKKD